MGFSLLFSSCAVAIHDTPFCSPMPGYRGAVCDSFVTHKREVLTWTQWEGRKAEWQAQGLATECTTSKGLGEMKAEIEHLCSKTPCKYDATIAGTK